MRPADLLLVHGDSWQGRAIRFGEWLGGRGSYFDHIALYTDSDGSIVEALASGIVRSHESAHASDVCLRVSIEASDEDRAEAVGFALKRVGTRYDWLATFGMLLSRLTPIVIALDGTEMCSSLVARALERCGYDFGDPYRCTPGMIAASFGVDG
jgi:uncharacterized protein YycO